MKTIKVDKGEIGNATLLRLINFSLVFFLSSFYDTDLFGGTIKG
jgi:hypothetical protein